MYSIFFHHSFGVKTGQSFPGLFISWHIMLICSKLSIAWSYIEWFIHHLSIFWSWPISTVFSRSFLQTFAAEIILIAHSISAAVRFAANTELFSSCKFFPKKTWLSFILFLVCVAAHSGKEVCWVGIKTLSAVSQTLHTPIVSFLLEEKSSQVFFEESQV